MCQTERCSGPRVGDLSNFVFSFLFFGTFQIFLQEACITGRKKLKAFEKETYLHAMGLDFHSIFPGE